MLLKQLTTSSEKKLAKINRYLNESFGFTLNSNVKTTALEKMYEQIEKELYQMKLDNLTPVHSEYSKKLLMKEGIATLLAANKLKLTENVMPVDQIKGKVVSWLCDYACKCINIGDSIDDAVGDAMRHYRSSKYRFPDQMIEQMLRNDIHSKMDSKPQPATLYDSITEDIDVDDVADAIYNKIEIMYPEIVTDTGADTLGTAIMDVAELHVGELTSDAIDRHVDEVLEHLKSGLYESAEQIAELGKKLRAVEDHLRKIKDSNLERKDAIQLGDPTDPKTNYLLDSFSDQDKVKYVELWELMLKINRALSAAHRDKEAHRVSKQPKREPSPVYPEDRPGRYMGDSKEYKKVDEKAPSGMEDWILANKESFKERYGDRWEQVLYATAWKMAKGDNKK